jgi:hypothetical protein
MNSDYGKTGPVNISINCTVHTYGWSVRDSRLSPLLNKNFWSSGLLRRVEVV